MSESDPQITILSSNCTIPDGTFVFDIVIFVFVFVFVLVLMFVPLSRFVLDKGVDVERGRERGLESIDNEGKVEFIFSILISIQILSIPLFMLVFSF